MKEDRPIDLPANHQKVQQGLDESSDVLSLFKVGSAKQWKELSKNLVVSVQDDIDDEPSPRGKSLLSIVMVFEMN